MRLRRFETYRKRAFPKILRLFATLLAVLLSFSWPRPGQASFEFSRERWDSMTEFLAVARSTLGKDRVVLGAQLDWGRLSAADAVLIVHPEVRVEFGEASAFLSAGGRLAVIDDYGKADQLLGRFHIQRVSAPSQPLEMRGNNPQLAIARPHVLSDSDGASLRHPIVSEVGQVVTNHPTALATDPEVELTPVLTLSNARGEETLFAVIGVIGDAAACGLTNGIPTQTSARCGRLFAMGDPSVFINLMMHFEGNRELAKGLLRYLVEDDGWGKRQGRLFVVTNDFQQTGQFGGKADMQRKLESALDDAQRLLDELRQQGLPSKLALLLASLLAIGGSAWAFRSSGRVYNRPTPRYAKAVPMVAQGGAAGRAAVLAAPTTHRALVVLELKAAAEQAFRHALRLPVHSSATTIMEAVERSGIIDRRAQKVLGGLFTQMAAAEKAVLSSESIRVTTESVKHMRRELEPILEQVERYAGRSS